MKCRFDEKESKKKKKKKKRHIKAKIVIPDSDNSEKKMMKVMISLPNQSSSFQKTFNRYGGAL